MQAKPLVLALLSLLPIAASAQTAVVVYGVVDAAVALEDTDAPGAKSRKVINSGNNASNRVGFRGTEDLGNGLKAIFNLEAGFAIDTGVGDAALFGRRAIVGLEGRFGSVVIGREYTLIDVISGQSNALGQGFYGSNLSAFGTGRLTRRLNNALVYKSKPFAGGLRGMAAVGLGETLTGPSQNYRTLALDYTAGPLYLGGAYGTLDRLATGEDKEWILGAAYTVGKLEFKANLMVADPIGASNKFSQVNVGGAYTIGNGKIIANYQTNEINNGAKGNSVAVTYSHSLSKRTNVYASAAIMRNNARGTFGLNAASTNVTPPATALGADPTALSFGVRHQF